MEQEVEEAKASPQPPIEYLWKCASPAVITCMLTMAQFLFICVARQRDAMVACMPVLRVSHLRPINTVKAQVDLQEAAGREAAPHGEGTPPHQAARRLCVPRPMSRLCSFLARKALWGVQCKSRQRRSLTLRNNEMHIGIGYCLAGNMSSGSLFCIAVHLLNPSAQFDLQCASLPPGNDKLLPCN